MRIEPGMERRPLRICFLTYRGNPQCGGQGIYTRHLTGALAALGHEVEVWSGPPYPELVDGVGLRQVPSLDLWNDEALFRRPTLREFRDPIHRNEWLRTITGQFPEPHTFSRRVARAYARLDADDRFDVVHDNQCLGEGLLRLARQVPVVATIHHPITVDRDIALAAARTRTKRWGLRRWYSFLDQQIAVATTSSPSPRRRPRGSSAISRSPGTVCTSFPTASISGCSARCRRSPASHID